MLDRDVLPHVLERFRLRVWRDDLDERHATNKMRISRSKRSSRLIADSRANSRATCNNRCTRSVVRANRTFQPLSSRLSPMADDKCDLPPAWRPHENQVGAIAQPAVAGA